jgi:hypothetical protein
VAADRQLVAVMQFLRRTGNSATVQERAVGRILIGEEDELAVAKDGCVFSGEAGIVEDDIGGVRAADGQFITELDGPAFIRVLNVKYDLLH